MDANVALDLPSPDCRTLFSLYEADAKGNAILINKMKDPSDWLAEKRRLHMSEVYARENEARGKTGLFGLPVRMPPEEPFTYDQREFHDYLDLYFAECYLVNEINERRKKIISRQARRGFTNGQTA